MKVEFHIEGPATTAAFAAFLPAYSAAILQDEETWREKRAADGIFTGGALGTPTQAPEAAPTPAPEPAKKTRGKAAAKEPEPAIRATPEDRKPPVEEVEEAEIVEDVFDDAPAVTLTREDVKLALAAYAEKFGMAKAQAEGPKLMGAPRLSALPDEQEAFAKAIKALREAVANG